jgi:hypothetical protein
VEHRQYLRWRFGFSSGPRQADFAAGAELVDELPEELSEELDEPLLGTALPLDFEVPLSELTSAVFGLVDPLAPARESVR